MLRRLWLHIQSRIAEARAKRSLRRAADAVMEHAQCTQTADFFRRAVDTSGRRLSDRT